MKIRSALGVGGLMLFSVAAGLPPAAAAPPTVTITAPQHGTVFVATASITITAATSDPDGSPISIVRFFANGARIGTDSEAPYEVVWSAVATGTYLLTARSTDRQREVSTSAPITVTVQQAPPAPPDLTATAPVAAPASPVEGQSMSFSATIANAGSGAAPASQAGARVDVGADGSYDVAFPARAVPALASGATSVVAWDDAWTAQLGTHRFEVCADQGTQVSEASELNNCTTATFTVTPAPPASITVAADAAPAALVEPGGGYEVRISVSNDSTIHGVEILALVDDIAGDLDGVGTCDVPVTLAPAQTLACAYPHTFTGSAGDARDHRISASGTDDEGAALEASDDATIAIVAPPPPADLVAEGLVSAPATPVEGQRLSFTATISNPGSGEAGASQVGLHVDLGADGTVDVELPTRPIPSLPAGSGSVATWSAAWSGPAGTHRFEICADQAAAVTEASEDNNCAGSSFTIDPLVCTQVIGFSQTEGLFRGMESLGAVDDARWELLAHPGATIGVWANANHSHWNEPIHSPCATRSRDPDRVILTITGQVNNSYGSLIASAIQAIRSHYPNVRSIRLQAIIGGPAHQTCPWGSGTVLASAVHPVIDAAIAPLAGGDVAAGADALVRTCADYRDQKGHLTTAGNEHQALTVGAFYTSGS